MRLSPAQSTGIHGWGAMLKTTLSWRDVEERDDIDLDLLLRWQVPARELHKLQPDVNKWVMHAGARAKHAVFMTAWGAHPLRDLHGDLADVIALRATSKQLKAMGVTYQDLQAAGMIPDTMRLMGLSFQGWVDLGLTVQDTMRDFTDAQLSKVFLMTRGAVMSCYRC